MRKCGICWGKDAEVMVECTFMPHQGARQQYYIWVCKDCETHGSVRVGLNPETYAVFQPCGMNAFDGDSQ